MVELKDIIELEVVHRALMAARFSDYPSDPVLLGSPYAATIHSLIVDDIIAGYRDKYLTGVAIRWEKWRIISKERHEWVIVKQQLSLPEMRWDDISKYTDKCQLVRTCFEPFEISEKLVDDMISEISELTY